MLKTASESKKSVHAKEDRKKDKIKRVAVAAIFILIIIINALYYAFTHVEGISEYGDDPTYTNLAGALLHGTYQINNYIFSVRLTEVFAIAFFYEIFGISNFTSALWNITSYIGIIIVAFYTAKYFYGNKAALLSAFVVSIFPLVTKYAVTIGEDIPLAFIGSFAILLFLYGERYNKREYYFFSGFLLVAAWLTSPEAVIVIAFLFLYAIIELLRKKIIVNQTTLFFIYGIVVLFIIVFIYSYINSGKTFATITTNTNFYSAVGGSVNGAATIPSANTDLNFYIDSMFQYGVIRTFTQGNPIQALNFIYGELFGQVQTFEYGLYFYLIIPIVALLIIFREKKSFFLMFWTAFMWLWLELGPMHVGITLSPFSITYLLAHRLLRFMLVIAVPLSCLIGIGLSKLLEQKNKILFAGGCIIVVLILALLYANNYYISNFWYYWQHYPNSLMMQATNYLKPVITPNTEIYLEAYYNHAYVGYSEGTIATFLGNPSNINKIDYNINSTTNCSVFMNYSYVIWAGPPHCPNWVNKLNITVPNDVPSYIINGENYNLGYIITNVYYVN